MSLGPAAVASYLDRLGVSGPVPAGSAAALARIQEHHLRTVPFENLDVVAGRRLDYRLPALHDKIVTRRRGGWCLETNWLLGHVLIELGFRTSFTGAGVAARGGFKHDLSHLLLTVTADGEDHLVDVGFGHGGYPRPLPARPGDHVRSTGTYRVAEDGGRLVVSRVVDGAAEPMYRTAPGDRHIDEFAATSEFHELSPASPFNASPHCVRLCGDEWATVSGDRLLLRGERLAEHPLVDPDLRAAALAWVLDGAPRPVSTTSPAAPGSDREMTCTS